MRESVLRRMAKGAIAYFWGSLHLANRLRIKPDEPNETNEKSALTSGGQQGLSRSLRKSMNLVIRHNSLRSHYTRQ